MSLHRLFKVRQRDLAEVHDRCDVGVDGLLPSLERALNRRGHSSVCDDDGQSAELLGSSLHRLIDGLLISEIDGSVGDLDVGVQGEEFLLCVDELGLSSSNQEKLRAGRSKSEGSRLADARSGSSDVDRASSEVERHLVV